MAINVKWQQHMNEANDKSLTKLEISADAKANIKKSLLMLEEKWGCKFLMAVESGSRAWGFASLDSDYDIRAIYVNPLDWYLCISENIKDTHEIMLPGDLDVSAWELRKALRLFLRNNSALLEWVDSPTIYLDSSFMADLKALITQNFSPLRVAHHYASMFNCAIKDRSSDGSISLKKLCYALRANLCIEWIFKHETMPPTWLPDVIAGLDIDKNTREIIHTIIERKSGATEKDRIVIPQELMPIIVDRTDDIARRNWSRTGYSPDIMCKLDEILRHYVTSDGWVYERRINSTMNALTEIMSE